MRKSLYPDSPEILNPLNSAVARPRRCCMERPGLPVMVRSTQAKTPCTTGNRTVPFKHHAEHLHHIPSAATLATETIERVGIGGTHVDIVAIRALSGGMIGATALVNGHNFGMIANSAENWRAQS